jgi:hypothetical protein
MTAHGPLAGGPWSVSQSFHWPEPNRTPADWTDPAPHLTCENRTRPATPDGGLTPSKQQASGASRPYRGGRPTPRRDLRAAGPEPASASCGLLRPAVVVLGVGDKVALLCLGAFARALPDGQVAHEVVGAAPCQCRFPGGVWMVSPCARPPAGPPSVRSSRAATSTVGRRAAPHRVLGLALGRCGQGVGARE